jgi:hypothetical protein
MFDHGIRRGQHQVVARSVHLQVSDERRASNDENANTPRCSSSASWVYYNIMDYLTKKHA